MRSDTPLLSRDGVPASTVHLPRGDWTTVLDALCARFPRIAREAWRDRMNRGVVLDADGQPIEPQRAYRFGLCVHYFREVPAETPIPFEATVLHRDEHLVIADKPHFLAVMPAGVHVRETLLTRLIERLDNPHLVPLHRIDRGTAGLVMLSPNPKTRAQYQALFRTDERAANPQTLRSARTGASAAELPSRPLQPDRIGGAVFSHAGSGRNAEQRNDHRRARTACEPLALRAAAANGPDPSVARASRSARCRHSRRPPLPGVAGTGA